MKRAWTLILALCLLLAALPALAEETGVIELGEGEVLAIDLDGDGTEEAVRWALAEGDYSDDVLTLFVTAADGTEASYTTQILYGTAFVTDLDGDGRQELLLTGDVMSDDYITWCLRWDGAGLYEVLFPDCGRGEVNDDGYYTTGYGAVTELGDGCVTLTGSQDMLETWFASRTMVLTPHDRFEFNDSGLWTRDPEALELGEIWAHGSALTLKIALDYYDEAGNLAGTLQPGDRMLVYATDKQTFVRFVASDGSDGFLEIGPDYERGWGWRVNDIPEADCFEFLLYAD